MKLKIDLSKLRNHKMSFKSPKLLNLLNSLKSSKTANKLSNLSKKLKLKPSKSSKLSLSKRDFILVGLLVLGLEGYGLYSMFLSPKWIAYSSVKTHFVAQQLLVTNLEKDMAKKDQYLENLKLLDYKLRGLTREIPAEIPQEEIVLTLNKLAKTRELELGGIVFSTISTMSKQDFTAGKTSSATTKEATGNTPASTPNDTTKTTIVAPKVMGSMVLTENVDIAFSGSYGALYNFISDLEKSERKIMVKEVSMTRGAGSILKGTLKVQYVGYTNPEGESTYSLETPPVKGKVSPFLAFLGFEDNAAASSSSLSNAGPGPALVKTLDPNFYLLLNTYDDNAPKIIMGDYAKNGTELYSNTNDKVQGKISISGNLDKMTYSYSLGSSTKTKDAKLLLDGGKLRLDVISQQRKNDTDKVSITLDIDNKTDYPLEINVINDDKNAPRFNVGNKSGSVVVK